MSARVRNSACGPWSTAAAVRSRDTRRRVHTGSMRVCVCEVHPDRADEKQPKQVHEQETSDLGGILNCEGQGGDHPRQGSGREGPVAKAACSCGSRHTRQAVQRAGRIQSPPDPEAGILRGLLWGVGDNPAGWPEAALGCPPGVRDAELMPRTQHGPAKVELKGPRTKGAARERHLPLSASAAAWGGRTARSQEGR